MWNFFSWLAQVMFIQPIRAVNDIVSRVVTRPDKANRKLFTNIRRAVVRLQNVVVIAIGSLAGFGKNFTDTIDKLQMDSSVSVALLCSFTPEDVAKVQVIEQQQELWFRLSRGMIRIRSPRCV